MKAVHSASLQPWAETCAASLIPPHEYCNSSHEYSIQSPAPSCTLSSIHNATKGILFNMDMRLDNFTQNSPTSPNSAVVTIKSETPRPSRICLPCLLIVSWFLTFCPRLPCPVCRLCCPLPQPYCALLALLCSLLPLWATPLLCVSRRLSLPTPYSLSTSLTRHLLSKAFLCYPVKSSPLFSTLLPA